MHVHVRNASGEAKFWLEPIIALAKHDGFSTRELGIIQSIIEERSNEIKKYWKKHFSS